MNSKLRPDKPHLRQKEELGWVMTHVGNEVEYEDIRKVLMASWRYRDYIDSFSSGVKSDLFEYDEKGNMVLKEDKEE